MKNLKHLLMLFLILAGVVNFGIAGKHAQAQTGTVQSWARNAPYGDYIAYLFVTGNSSPTRTTSVFRISQGGKLVTFTNVPTNKRYFIRVVGYPSDWNTYGGQCDDQYFLGGTMTLHDTNLVYNWGR